MRWHYLALVSVILSSAAGAAPRPAVRRAPVRKPAPTRKVAPARKPVPARKLPARNPPTPSATHAVLRQRCAGMTNRINAHDIGGVRGYFSRSLRVRGERGTRMSYYQTLASMSRTFQRFPRYRTRLDVQKVQVRGDRAYLTAAYENLGMKRPERGRCNMVWRRTAGRWLLESLSGA